MTKKLLSMLLAGTMVLSIAACGSGSGESKGTTAAPTEAETTAAAEPETTAAATEAAGSYQDILDEYSQKLKDATPGIVEEYNTEAEALDGDLTALADLSTKKIEKLAEISVEGIEKMAELKLKNGDSDEVYNEWADKLNAAYEGQAQQITDAYMYSVQ